MSIREKHPQMEGRNIDSDSYGSSDDGSGDDIESTDDTDNSESNGVDSDDSDDEFEQQSSSSSGESEVDSNFDSEIEVEEEAGGGGSEFTQKAELNGRRWKKTDEKFAKTMDTEDLSSDDESERANTVGRVPLHWYDSFDHVGYDVEGKKVLKRKGNDRIDQALDNEDSSGNRVVYDMYNDRTVELSERDLQLIRRIQAGTFAHPEFNDTLDYVPYVSSQVESMPLSARPEPKHKFLPSRFELTRLRAIVRAIRAGRYRSIADREKDKIAAMRGEGAYLMWGDSDDELTERHKYHLPAPKPALPGHAESYNPPQEYLRSEEEQSRDKDDEDVRCPPKSHSCLRHVGAYQHFVKERFERCLDLYLCPRKMKMRLNIDPNSLVPKLPRPRELRPYPQSLCLQYIGHTGPVRSLSISPDGQYLASGGEDGCVRLWEVATALCRHVWMVGSPVLQVAFNPNPQLDILAVATRHMVILITSGIVDTDGIELTEAMLSTVKSAAHKSKSDITIADEVDAEGLISESGERDGASSLDFEGQQKAGRKVRGVALWKLPQEAEASPTNKKVGARVILELGGDVAQLSWHHKGDYLATVAASEKGAFHVAVHQISKGKTQYPFSKSPGLVQCVMFHPSRPFLFVVTQQHVKIFHLVEQSLVKKLLSGCKWLSCADVHSSGDHIVLGSFDRRVVWFDLDLSSKPFRTLKFHEKAVRSVLFHRRFPLLASASDDGSTHVFHATVYSDLSRDPLLVPLKVLKSRGSGGVLSLAFHPRQPWLFSAGNDGIINLYQDL